MIQLSTTRKFRHKDILLDDPSEAMSIQEVANFYANEYPELTTATIVGPELEAENVIYSFKSVLGDKG